MARYPAIVLSMVSAACVFGSPGRSSAEVIRKFNIGPWLAGAYSDDATKKFSHCAGSAAYKSGIWMIVSISRNFEWRIGFSSENWNLQQNQQIPVQMTFDGSAPVTGAAFPINTKQAVIPMPDNSSLANLFRAANRMSVYAQGQLFQFVLTGTSRLMPELAQCVRAELAIERGERPPTPPAITATRSVRPTPPPPPVATVSEQPQADNLEVVSMRIASNLLLQAQLPNARLLSASETPSMLKGHGTAWTSDAGVGAISLLPASAAKDSQAVGSSMINSDSSTCKGDFASGRSSEMVDDTIVSKAFTACKDSGGTRAIRYYILHKEGEGFVVFANAGGQAETEGGRASEATFQAAAIKAAFTH